MSVTSGFFNSLNGDRKYNTTSISELFDGVIEDGVFSTIGDQFIPKLPDDGGTSILISTGRAWFNNVWIKNDTILAVPSTDSHLILDRIDAVVFNVDTSEATREATIIYIEGVPSTSPTKPNLLNGEYVNQYPICYITRKSSVNTITQSNVENMVGGDECPFVVGAAVTTSVSDLTLQWKSQWDDWTDAEKIIFNNWTSTQESDWITWSDDKKTIFTTYMAAQQQSFTDWYDGIKAMLDGDIAITFADSISTLQTDMSTAKSDISTLETDMTTDMNNAQSDISTLKTDMSTAQSDISTLETNVSTLETNTNTSVSELNSGKENKATYIKYTLQNSGWSASVYSGLEILYPAETYNLEIQLSNSCTSNEIDAWNDAKILGSITNNNLYAKGDYPTISIPTYLKIVEVD